MIVLGINEYFLCFLHFKDEPLMSCRLCLEGENIWEKLYLLEFAGKLLGGPPCFLLVLCMNSWSLLLHCSSSNIISGMVTSYWRVAEKFFARPSNMYACSARDWVGWGLLEENPQSGLVEIRALQRATIGVLPTYATRLYSGMKRVKCGWTQPSIPQGQQSLV